MIIREERIGGQRLILGDCREILGGLNYDAICADPPYGLNYAAHPIVGKGKARSNHDREDWDAVAPDPAMFLGSPAIVWGENHIGFPAARGWLIWVKRGAPPSMAGCEMAWTNLPINAKVFDWSIAATNAERVGHPTQKPLALMQWCLSFLPGQTVVDPFMGSGTTLVACQRAGRNGIGIELNPKHFATACRRVEEAARQPDMFVAPPPAPVQESLL